MFDYNNIVTANLNMIHAECKSCGHTWLIPKHKFFYVQYQLMTKEQKTFGFLVKQSRFFGQFHSCLQENVKTTLLLRLKPWETALSPRLLMMYPY